MHTPSMIHETALLAGQDALAGGYILMTLRAPKTVALARPGQFVHLRIPGLGTAALRRPFSIYNAQDEILSIVYKRVGRGTEHLSTLPVGTPLDLIGPLGNGFPALREGALPVLVAGGYGVAPLHFLARALPAQGHLFAGGRTAADVLCIEAFEKLGWTTHVATEDGSLGTRGRVTDALLPWQAERPATALDFFSCGPAGLLKALADNLRGTPHPVWISLDKHMVCGVGACLACVQKIKLSDGAVAQLRVCHDGPVFEARSVAW